MTPRRRARVLLFLMAACAFGYFHPGGGWNQNARFAMVRALVEERRPSIDSFLVYERASPDKSRLRRLPVRDARLERGGRTAVLTWAGPDKKPVPISPSAPADAPRLSVEDVAATGDLAFASGHFHPNKAPGMSLLAAPAYALLHALDRAWGGDPDDWGTLTRNAWLTSWLSVGLVAAAGLVLFHRLARRLGASESASLLATVGLGFGTLYWSYATQLFEHDPMAVALLASYACLAGRRPSAWLTAGAGAAAGAAVVLNYVAVFPAVFLALYLAAAAGPRRVPALATFAAGAVVPLSLLAAYNEACFGRLFTTNYQYENPLFVSTRPALLGVLDWPPPGVLLALLLSPFRGMLVTSPVLLLGGIGLFHLWREPERRREAALFTAVAGFFLLFNCSFNNWHGGWAAGPRYLVPAFPFLALAMTRALERPAVWKLALLTVSIALNGLACAVDPNPPVGVAGHAMRPDIPRWRTSPLLDYQWPLFTEGRARPVLDAQRDALLSWLARTWESQGVPKEQIRARLAGVREQVEAAVARGDDAPLSLARIHGPVSVNPTGIYEAWAFRIFAPRSPEAEGNAANAGEWLFPGSRLSLLPLAGVFAAGLVRLRVFSAFGRNSRHAAV